MPTCSALRCSYKHVNKSNGKTIHRFPFSRPEILKKWVHNVGRKNWFPSKSSVLCSNHFEKHCFTNVGSYVSLKKDAVPTLFYIPSHLKKGRWLWENHTNPELDNSTAQNLPHIKREEIDLLTEETPQDNLSDILSLKNDHKYESSSTNTEPRLLTDTPHIVKYNVISNESLSDSLTNSPNEVNFRETSTTKSSRFLTIESYRSLACLSRPSIRVEPEPMLQKTQKLQKKLEKANQTIREYRSKVKVKQQSIRRLNKRINSMQAEINHLRKKNFLTEHTADLLKENFSGLPLDIILRTLNKKKPPYAPSLQSFALTLYRYSPKAYNYVQSVFDSSLPKGQAVRRWRALEKKRELAEKNNSSLEVLAALASIEEVPPKENNCISDANVLQPGDSCILNNTNELSSEDNCVLNNVNELQSEDSSIWKDTDKSELEENNCILVNGNELQLDENGIVIVDKELQPIPNCFVYVTNDNNS